MLAIIATIATTAIISSKVYPFTVESSNCWTGVRISGGCAGQTALLTTAHANSAALGCDLVYCDRPLTLIGIVWCDWTRVVLDFLVRHCQLLGFG